MLSSHYAVIAGIAFTGLLILVFSTLTYSLRDFLRPQLAELLKKRGKSSYFDPTVDHAEDLAFVTAVVRMALNLFLLIGFLYLFSTTTMSLGWQYLAATISCGLTALIVSVTIPHTLAKHAAEQIIALMVGPLHFLRMLFWPLVQLSHWADRVMLRARGTTEEENNDNLEQEILSAVEAGEKEGVVDEQEREMIESVMEMAETQVSEIMTARTAINALEVNSPLTEVKRVLEESGHSRIPVYEESLDHMVGVLHARDLLKLLGLPASEFNIRALMRPVYYVPETKPLPDLLRDFRELKVHIAIVQDEYGGTAGLVTIEDVLEELVGEISDEHEPVSPELFHRVDDYASEVDARIEIHELNRLMHLELPDDEGYNTLSGFVTTTLGRIPETGSQFERDEITYTVIAAEPQRVTRVRIERAPKPVEAKGE
jgi:putative hemolysin